MSARSFLCPAGFLPRRDSHPRALPTARRRDACAKAVCRRSRLSQLSVACRRKKSCLFIVRAFPPCGVVSPRAKACLPLAFVAQGCLCPLSLAAERNHASSLSGLFALRRREPSRKSLSASRFRRSRISLPSVACRRKKSCLFIVRAFPPAPPPVSSVITQNLPTAV